MIEGEYTRPGTGVPKLGVCHGPHSPLAAPLVNSQSGRKLLERGSPAPKSLSFHVRCVCVTSVVAGLFAAAYRMESCSTPRLALALMAVLPFPNRSYAAETRGLMSFQLGTFSTAAKLLLRFGSHRCGAAVNGSVDSFCMSSRTPPARVNRFSVQRSCA